MLGCLLKFPIKHFQAKIYRNTSSTWTFYLSPVNNTWIQQDFHLLIVWHKHLLQKTISCFNYLVPTSRGDSSYEKYILVLDANCISSLSQNYNWQPSEHLWGSRYNYYYDALIKAGNSLTDVQELESLQKNTMSTSALLLQYSFRFKGNWTSG